MDYVSNIGEYVNWLQGYNRNTVGNHPVRQPTLEDYLNSDRTNKLIDALLWPPPISSRKNDNQAYIAWSDRKLRLIRSKFMDLVWYDPSDEIQGES